MSIVFWFQKVEPSLMRIQPQVSHQPLREMYEIGNMLPSRGWEVVESVSPAAKFVKKTCQYPPRRCSVSTVTLGV
jgi:hypothetical protein